MPFGQHGMIDVGDPNDSGPLAECDLSDGEVSAGVRLALPGFGNGVYVPNLERDLFRYSLG